MKKRWYLLPLTLLIAFCTGCEVQSSGNILGNPDFEKGSGPLPALWSENIWTEHPGTVSMGISKQETYSGGQAVFIEAPKPADAKIMQQIPVKPESIYKISGYIKAEGIPKGNIGANISVLEVSAYSNQVFDSQGQWVYAELYGKTGKNQKTLRIAARIGGYSSVNKGKAWFDALAVEKLNKFPAGVSTYQFSQAPAPKAAVKTEGSQRKTVPLSEVWRYTVFYLLFFVILYLAFIYQKPLTRLLKKKGPVELPEKSVKIIFWGTIVAGLILRVAIAPGIEGYQNDINCFRLWSDRAATLPYPDFYADNYFCDYPPGYIYVLSFLGHIRKILGIDLYSPQYLLILKSPAILADMAMSILIFFIAKEKVGRIPALIISAMYNFNPGVILTSAIWGQVDSVAAVLVMLILYFVSKEKIWLASLLMGFSLIVKLQTGFAVFIIIFALIRGLVRRNDWKNVGLSLLCGLGTFALGVLPFNIGKSPTWIFSKIGGTVGGYQYATVNAFNFFTIFNGNWQKADNLMYTNRVIPWATLLNGVMSYAEWAMFFMILLFLFVFILYFVAKDESRNFSVALVFISGLFMFMIVMHERYLFPALILALLSYVYTKDHKYLFVYAGFSLTYFINAGHILDVLINHPRAASVPLSKTVAWLNLGVFGFLVFVSINNYIKKHVFRSMFKH